jgi:hypothetical protein
MTAPFGPLTEREVDINLGIRIGDARQKWLRSK